jgi:hypothetical protein
MRVTDATPQPKASRWLIAAAIFGGVCNLSCVVLTLYQNYCRHYPLDSYRLIPIALSLVPLLVLFALRRVVLVVLIYVSMLFLDLGSASFRPPAWLPWRSQTILKIF